MKGVSAHKTTDETERSGDLQLKVAARRLFPFLMDGADEASPFRMEISLASADQLFSTFDPSPFHERDLDPEAERFIAGWARESPKLDRLHLRVILADTEANKKVGSRIPDAIHHFFAYRAVQGRQDLRELLRIGWRSLAIGMTVLAACYFAIRYVDVLSPPSPVRDLTEQGLAILGWVANWRPLEIFLYDWWPILRRIKLFNQLAVMPVEVTISE